MGELGPSEGYCNVGELCDTGVSDDYCCNDMEGRGSYCSETGGSGEAVRLR
jgi:hypothetical protein